MLIIIAVLEIGIVSLDLKLQQGTDWISEKTISLSQFYDNQGFGQKRDEIETKPKANDTYKVVLTSV